MIDDGVSPQRASAEPDRVVGPSDGLSALPDHHIGWPLAEMVIDFGPLDGPARSTSSIEPELALPEDLWGEPREGTGAMDAVDLQLRPDTPMGEDWWRPAEDVDGVLGPEVDALPVGPRVAPLAQRRPELAPAPAAIGRSHARRRSTQNLHLNRRVAWVGLAGIAMAGLATLATRPSEDATPQRQVISAGTGPVTSVTTSSAPVSTTTAPTGALVAAGPARVTGGAPTTVVSNGAPRPPTTAGQAVTDRSPSPATSTTTARELLSPAVILSPAPPAAPPATEAPATIAEPEYGEPDTTPTTRRPRVTIPRTTAVPNTTMSKTPDPPADK